MDLLDIKILKLLQNNARITVSEISSQINLSAPAVSDRLKKLESSGAIAKYTAILSPKYFKKELVALMFISLERPKYTEGFLEFIAKKNDILECHYIAGDFDYALKIVTENTATLERLLSSIKSVPGVHKTRTSVVLSTHKEMPSIVPDSKSEE